MKYADDTDEICAVAAAAAAADDDDDDDDATENVIAMKAMLAEYI